MVGEPVELEIDTLTWNSVIEEHLARHDVTHGDVMAVLDSEPLTHENLPDRGGTHIMIGPDGRGRILYVSSGQRTHQACGSLSPDGRAGSHDTYGSEKEARNDGKF